MYVVRLLKFRVMHSPGPETRKDVTVHDDGTTTVYNICYSFGI